MARIINQAEPVVVLAGHVLREEFSDAQGSCQVLIRDDIVVDAPAMLRDFLVYISTPRLRSQALGRISSEGGTEQDLDQLILSGRVLELPDGKPSAQLSAFSGVRLMPMGYPVRVSGPDGAVVWVGPDEGSTQLLPVSGLLGSAMWEQQAGEDLPSTTARLTADTGLSHDEASRLVLNDLHALLALRLARLEVVESGTPLKRLRSFLSRMLRGFGELVFRLFFDSF